MTDPYRTNQPYSKVRVGIKARYDREAIFSILDAGLVAHVGFIIDERPMVMPMAYARVDDLIYIHGAKAARIIKAPSECAPVCLTVTHIDALVVARSAFHHSVNYRSAVIHGTFRKVTDSAEKEAALVAVTNHLLPGRWDEVRPMSAKELQSTGVLAVEIEAASAKSREGPPIDEEDDYALPYWAGLLPVSQVIGKGIDDGRLAPETTIPVSLNAARQKFSYR